MDTKKCNTCGVIKEHSEFGKKKLKSGNYGLTHECKALKSNKAGRKWESIVGYTLDELKAHFIKTMPKGRTLDDAFNGKMHIDHIVPKSIFDFSNEDQIKQAWCLTNLRLVDAKDNLSKGEKCIYLL